VPLYEIRVYFETDDEHGLERLTAGFERVICPHPPVEDHRCPNRWNIMTIALEPAEAAEVDGMLNQ
jgi:hypothetical protein